MKPSSRHWTWQAAQQFFEVIAPEDLSQLVRVFEENDLARRTKAAVLSGPMELFAPLRDSQPLTWAALTNKCEAPLIIKSKIGVDLYTIVSVCGALPVFIDPFSTGDDLVDWEAITRCLPPFMLAYYTNFNGLHASLSAITGPVSFNLPANVKKWRRLSDLVVEEGIKRNAISKLVDDLGDADNIKVVVETDWGDLVLVNCNANDQKLYVVPELDFSAVYCLADPAPKLDSLFARIINEESGPQLRG